MRRLLFDTQPVKSSRGWDALLHDKEKLSRHQASLSESDTTTVVAERGARGSAAQRPAFPGTHLSWSAGDRAIAQAISTGVPTAPPARQPEP